MRDFGPNIPPKGSVTIGDVGDGGSRIGFEFENGRLVESGFIKVFWSTTFIDLSDIEQAALGNGVVNSALRKTFLDRQPYEFGEWGTLSLKIVHSKC